MFVALSAGMLVATNARADSGDTNNAPVIKVTAPATKLNDSAKSVSSTEVETKEVTTDDKALVSSETKKTVDVDRDSQEDDREPVEVTGKAAVKLDDTKAVTEKTDDIRETGSDATETTGETKTSMLVSAVPVKKTVVEKAVVSTPVVAKSVAMNTASIGSAYVATNPPETVVETTKKVDVDCRSVKQQTNYSLFDPHNDILRQKLVMVGAGFVSVSSLFGLVVIDHYQGKKYLG